MYNTYNILLTGYGQLIGPFPLQVTNAVAIVRPPGHHAERDYPCGFCLFNTAALAARYAKKASHDPLMRILILDWDVHHGNGTQHMFEDDDR